MIGQNIGLKYLIPIAVEKQKENILAEGDHYDGELTAVLNLDANYWKTDETNYRIILGLFKKKKK